MGAILEAAGEVGDTLDSLHIEAPVQRSELIEEKGRDMNALIKFYFVQMWHGINMLCFCLRCIC